MSMEPRIVTLEEPIEVIGISIRTKVGSTHPDIPQLWQRYMKEGIAGRIPNKKTPSVYYGVSYDYDKSDRSFTYMAGEGVTTLEDLPEGLERYQIAAIKYAVFRVEVKSPDGFPEAIPNAMRYIYDTWLPNSDHEVAEGAGEFELYDERSHRKENAEMDIYVPIKRTLAPALGDYVSAIRDRPLDERFFSLAFSSFAFILRRWRRSGEMSELVEGACLEST